MAEICLVQELQIYGMRWMIVLCQWIMSQFLKESQENWDSKHSMVVQAYSGSNTDCKSSEPLKTLVMLWYVMLNHWYYL